MPDEYTTLQKAQDAREFAESRFGKHYIARLKSLRADALTAAQDISYTDSFRAHKATQASVLSQEIEYFRIAQVIQKNPSMMAKLKERIVRKEVGDSDV